MGNVLVPLVCSYLVSLMNYSVILVPLVLLSQMKLSHCTFGLRPLRYMLFVVSIVEYYFPIYLLHMSAPRILIYLIHLCCPSVVYQNRMCVLSSIRIPLGVIPSKLSSLMSSMVFGVLMGQESGRGVTTSMKSWFTIPVPCRLKDALQTIHTPEGTLVVSFSQQISENT